MRIPIGRVLSAGAVATLSFAACSECFSPLQPQVFQPSRSTGAFKTSQPNSRKAISSQLYVVDGLLGSIKSLLPKENTGGGAVSSRNTGNKSSKNAALQFLEHLNGNNIDAALELISDNDSVEWDECTFYRLCTGKQAIERRLRLQSETASFRERSFCVDEVAVDATRNSIGILFHKEKKGGERIPNSRGCAMFHLDSNKSTEQRIQRVCLITEPATRGGEAGLQILNQASKIMDATGYNPEEIKQEERRKGGSAPPTAISTTAKASSSSLLSPPEQYFDAWNRRNMSAAVNVFVDDMKYEDTAFPEPFVGKARLEEHLLKCADAFPDSFQIVIDQVAMDQAACKASVEWHFENEQGEALPFTQGCSFYKLNDKGARIVEGIDFIEPAVVKPSGWAMFADSLATSVAKEPLRLIPIVAWAAYMYIVFFSDGILPGANALQLEARTWEEVLNLSLNFFLVAPLLHLPFSPSVHPMLEGVFNLLLSWAAMFAGFLSDDRPRKPNLLPMFPIVVGMQFLTSAFLLPYLAVRSSESNTTMKDDVVAQEELPLVARVAGESPVLGGLMGLVGSGSILWFFLGRAEEYGSQLAVRYSSFVELLSIDRVGSSFLVDLAIFAVFQGWLVEDDLKRRGVSPGDELVWLERGAKFVPFFGLAAYLMLRPSLPKSGNGEVH